MQFFCLYKPSRPEGVPPAEQAMAGMMKLTEDMKRSGALVATGGCLPSAHGARIRFSGGTFAVENGPFKEPKGVVEGYAILQAKSKEEAIELTKRFLRVAGDGESEIRQMFEG
ncbi:MAG: hypothetical protein IPP78_07535 [Holophagaceae bacterium]|nr:hypothetical protein [Holophagaceae bacterium]